MENTTSTTPPTTQKLAPTTTAEEKGGNKVVAQSNTMAEAETKTVSLKRITAPLTIFCIILSLPFLFIFVWLLLTGTHDCETLLKLQKLQKGIATGVFILFAVSNIVALLRSKLRVIGLFLIMIPSILMLTVGLALMGAFKTDTQKMPGSPRWLTMKVHENYKWNEIKSCIYDTGTCKNLILKSYLLKSYEFTSTKLSPIESGCCMPPRTCDMDYINATYWKKGGRKINTSIPYDRDCDVWENDETVLCYNCQACSDGFLRPLKSKWSKIGIFLVVMSVLLILTHLILFVATMIEQFAR